MKVKEGIRHFLVVVFFLAGLASCGKSLQKVISEEALGPAEFVGSPVCGRCHLDIYDSFLRSGHPWKLRTTSLAIEAPFYGLPEIPFPAQSVCSPTNWNDISYVIGGYRWKARYVDKNGYILTGDGAQYNFATGSFVKYTSNPCGTKKYNCGSCHTTGFSSDGHQGELPGISGTWVFEGIQCERCHGGGGSRHVNFRESLPKFQSSDLCGDCHYRGVRKTSSPFPTTILAKAPFIAHHEQYNEYIATRHYQNARMECITCHDPHRKSSESIRVTCEECHKDVATTFSSSTMARAGVTCNDCHMAQATKSAVGDTNTLVGDVKTHLFAISMDPDRAFLEDDPNDIGGTDEPDRVVLTAGIGYLTLDYSCKRCHMSKTKQQMAGTDDDVTYDIHKNPNKQGLDWSGGQ